MCGLTGVFFADPTAPGEATAVVEMMRALSHRGPDGGGLRGGHWGALGHTRLALSDRSPASVQPLISRDRQLLAAVNGQFHNADALRRRPEVEAYGPRTRSDSELLIPLFAAHGPEAFALLEGPFVAAVVDLRESRPRLVLARDPLGQHPLHLCFQPDGLVFASELAALLPHVGERRLDPEVLRFFLHTGWLPPGTSPLRGIRQLQAGRFLSVCGARHEEGTYLEAPAPPPRDDGPPQERFEHAFADATRRRLASPRAHCVLLSGGLDSSAVLQEVVRQSAGGEGPRPVAFTLAWPEDRRLDESRRAASLTRKLGVEHHVVPFTADPMETLEALIRQSGELCGDASLLALAEVGRVASTRAAVALTGDGGDEAMLGYDRHRLLHLLFATRRGSVLRALPALSRLAAPLLDDRRRHRLRGLIAARTALDAMAHLLALAPASPELGSADEALATLISERAHALFDHPLRVPPDLLGASLDRDLYLVQDLLVKTDRALMASGVEGWSPFHDPAVSAALRAFPLARRRGKQPLRTLLRSRGLGFVLKGRKRGFAVPLSRWLNGGYGERLEALLSEEEDLFAPLFPAPGPRELLARHRRGEHRLAPVLHASAVLALFARHVRATPLPERA